MNIRFSITGCRIISGVTGVEGIYDSELHGRAGQESVLVNNFGYRQSEDVDSQPEPGENVVLTVDLDLQRAAEESLKNHQGADVNAAVVVMDVRNGDVLAMASSPTFDPNDFAQGISREKYQQLQELEAEKNRATYENYAPGSIFKTVVALAALENGLNVNEIYHVQADPTRPGKGCVYVGKRKIDDQAAPGDYDFKRAFIHSSNSYFVNAGLMHARHRKHCPHRQGISSGRGHAPVRAAGNARKFSDGKTNSFRLARRRHGECVHRPGPGGHHADSDGRHDFSDCKQWNDFVAAPRSAHRTARPGGGRHDDEFSGRPGARPARPCIRAACKFCAMRCLRTWKAAKAPEPGRRCPA